MIEIYNKYVLSFCYAIKFSQLDNCHYMNYTKRIYIFRCLVLVY